MASTAPQTNSPPTFGLRVGDIGVDKLRVTSFTGEEGISKLFRFDVDVLPADPSLDLVAAKLLGTTASFTLHDHQGTARIVNGVVGKVTAIGNRSHGAAPAFRVRVVPRLWLAKHRFTSRIYQHKTVPEIVDSLLTSVGVPHRFALTETYPIREYCVQYQESDLDFIKRVLAEEGIFFHFAHSATTHPKDDVDAVIFLDAARPGYARLKKEESHLDEVDGVPVIRLRDRTILGALSAHDDVGRFSRDLGIGPNLVLMKDYDFRRPLLDLSSKSEAALEDTEYHPPRDQALSVYHHHTEFADADITVERARRHVEQHRRKVHVANGETTCRVLVPGYRFHLESENSPQLNAEYVATRLEHKGFVPEFHAHEQVYQCSFECTLATVAFRPKRPKRQTVQVLESAVVVGPASDEIYTDDHGRVRVQFYWDTNGTADETSTTWLRVMQAWAGATWGTQFIPRVGTEVFVSFVGGDPDCPVIVGSGYNTARPYPFQLPRHKTKSGLRTQTSPGGAGFNELSFEDSAGSEQVYLKAQRDLDEEVGHDQTLTIGNSQHVEVKANQTNVVGGNRTEQITGAVDRLVGADERNHVKGTTAAVVSGNSTLVVEHERRADIRGSDTTEVRGRADWRTGDDLTIRTEGNFTTLVGKEDAQRSYTLAVEGGTLLTSKDLTEITSEKGIRVRCGESILEVMPDRIELVSPHICLRSPDARFTVDGDKIATHSKSETLFKAETVLMKGDKASLVLKTEVKADGAQILLNSPAVAKDPEPAEQQPPTVIELAGADGKPLAYQRYVIVLGDGSERSGFLDKDGRAELDFIDEAAKVTFPGLLEESLA
ncbi:MAG: type VI secretion system tip protein TssI/VgrG [Polyangiaceae bacterium]